MEYASSQDYLEEPVDLKRPVVPLSDGGYSLANLDVPVRKTNSFYLSGLFAISIFAGVGYFSNRGSTERIAFIPQVLAIFAILIIFVLRKLMSSPPRNWLSPDAFFVAVFSVFHFAYIVFYVFGIADYDKEVFWAPHQTLRATFFCICCLAAFLVGYEVIGKRYNNESSFLRLVPSPPNLILISKFLIIVALIFFWGVLLSQGGSLAQLQRSFTHYGALKAERFYWVSYDIAIVGIIMYCTGSGLIYHRYMTKGFFQFLALGFAVGVLLSGDRGGFARFLPIPIMAFHYFQRKIKIRWMIAAMLLFLFIFNVIGTVRSVAIFDVARITKEYKEAKPKEQSAITLSLLEFGASIKVVGIAMELVPSRHSYWYGKSYLNSLQIILPNIIPRVGFVRRSKGVGTWLTETAFPVHGDEVARLPWKPI
jgi:hypothetical protein